MKNKLLEKVFWISVPNRKETNFVGENLIFVLKIYEIYYLIFKFIN